MGIIFATAMHHNFNHIEIYLEYGEITRIIEAYSALEIHDIHKNEIEETI